MMKSMAAPMSSPRYLEMLESSMSLILIGEYWVLNGGYRGWKKASGPERKPRRAFRFLCFLLLKGWPHGRDEQTCRDVKDESGIYVAIPADGNKYLSGDGMAHEEGRADGSHPTEKGG